jgi:hypothetical protein
MFERYFSLLSKIWVSHSDQFCYLLMLSATLFNGGFFYLFYPIMIFGHGLI